MSTHDADNPQHRFLAPLGAASCLNGSIGLYSANKFHRSLGRHRWLAFACSTATIDSSMFSRIAMLLPIFALPSLLVAADASSMGEAVIAWNVSWSADQVAQTAAANSAPANLLESERSALLASIDRDDPKQCAQAALIQSVLRDLVCHERSRSTSQSLSHFYQLVHLERQQRLLDEANQTLEQLLRMADKADELGLKDGDRSALDKRRLQVHDQQAEAVGANAKLRVALAELLGKPASEVLDAEFVDVGTDIQDDFSVEQWIALAMSQRCDLRAIDTLCGCLSEDSLPAARQLLGSLQPGLGLAVAVAARKPLLSALHQDRGSAELCHRREQCARLRAARRDQIESQVRVAVIDKQTAVNRLGIVRRSAEIDAQQVAESITAIELDQAAPGADLLAKLDHLQAQGQVIERESALAVAQVKLREAVGSMLTD